MKSFYFLTIATLLGVAACNDKTTTPTPAQNEASKPIVTTKNNGDQTSVTVDKNAAKAKADQATDQTKADAQSAGDKVKGTATQIKDDAKGVGTTIKQKVDSTVDQTKKNIDDAKAKADAAKAKSDAEAKAKADAVAADKKKAEEAAKPTTNAAPAFNAQGNYATDCNLTASLASFGIGSVKRVFTFKDSNKLTVVESSYSDISCKEPTGELFYDTTYEAAEEIPSKPGLRGLNVTVVDISFTPRSETLAKAAAEGGLCGRQDWSNGKTYSIAGQKCVGHLEGTFPNKGTVYYGAAKDSGNFIEVSELPPRGDTMNYVAAASAQQPGRNIELKYKANKQ